MLSAPRGGGPLCRGGGRKGAKGAKGGKQAGGMGYAASVGELANPLLQTPWHKQEDAAEHKLEAKVRAKLPPPWPRGTTAMPPSHRLTSQQDGSPVGGLHETVLE